MEEIRLRDATPTDVPSICTIHNQGSRIEWPRWMLPTYLRTDGVVPPSWPRHPVIVAESIDGSIGWASSTSSRRVRCTDSSQIYRCTSTDDGEAKGLARDSGEIEARARPRVP
jgi:hypothetical protein